VPRFRGAEIGIQPRERRGVPEVEQLVAAGAAAEHIMLAAHAMGLGAFWRTGEAAYDQQIKAALGLDPGDAIIGFLYVGTPHSRAAAPPARPRPESQAFEWSGPGELAPVRIG